MAGGRTTGDVEDTLRDTAPRVLGRLVRRHGQFDACEEAVHNALLAAVRQWPEQGVPDHPEGWLLTVAARRLVDHFRSDGARRRREDAVASAEPDRGAAPAADEATSADHDDTLTLLFLCCHPALTAPSQVALTLRAVGGLTTAKIARALLVPDETMTRRISRPRIGSVSTVPASSPRRSTNGMPDCWRCCTSST